MIWDSLLKVVEEFNYSTMWTLVTWAGHCLLKCSMADRTTDTRMHNGLVTQYIYDYGLDMVM